MKQLVLEIGAGELLDRLTILEIKVRHAKDSAQRQRIAGELQRARELSDGSQLPLDQIAPLVSELREINERLWGIEDQLRLCEVNRDFGSAFVELSRSVYKNNDLRAALKRRIDERLSPSFLQDKIYSD